MIECILIYVWDPWFKSSCLTKNWATRPAACRDVHGKDKKQLSWLCQLQISYKKVQRDLELSSIVELRTSDWASGFASRVATLEIGTQRSVNSHSRRMAQSRPQEQLLHSRSCESVGKTFGFVGL